MAICTEGTLTCAYCGKPIVPLLEDWRACHAGAIHEQCWQQYLEAMGVAPDRNKSAKEVA